MLKNECSPNATVLSSPHALSSGRRGALLHGPLATRTSAVCQSTERQLCVCGYNPVIARPSDNTARGIQVVSTGPEAIGPPVRWLWGLAWSFSSSRGGFRSHLERVTLSRTLAEKALIGADSLTFNRDSLLPIYPFFRRPSSLRPFQCKILPWRRRAF